MPASEFKTLRRFQNTALQIQNMAKMFSLCFELSAKSIIVGARGLKCTQKCTPHECSENVNLNCLNYNVYIYCNNVYYNVYIYIYIFGINYLV